MSVSFTREDLPLPERPATPMKQPSGNDTSMFLRLLPRAPRSVRVSPFPRRRRAGTGIVF